MGRYGREAAWAFGVLGCCLAVVYALELSPPINAICLGVVAVGACVALAVGPSLQDPSASASYTATIIAFARPG